MAVLKLNDASFASFLSKPASLMGTDLSNASVLEALTTYEKHRRKKKPSYNLSSEKGSIEKIEEQFGTIIMPQQINDEFWMHYIMYRLMNNNVGSTCKTYCSRIITALRWCSRYRLPLSETYDEFDKDMCRYESTKVVLTPDDVSFIAHFDISTIPAPDKSEEYLADAKDVVEKRLSLMIEKAKKKWQDKEEETKQKYNEEITQIRNTKWRTSKMEKSHIAACKNKYLKRLALIRKKRDAAIEKLLASKEERIKGEFNRQKNNGYSQHLRHLRTLERVRDQFVLQCNLGQRYSDIIRMEPSCFSEDKTTYICVQKKTTNKAVVNINKFSFDRNIVRALLRKYDYHAPYPHCINNFNSYLHELLQAIGGRFNDIIKTENKVRDEMVIEEMPRYKAIASHTARRSFASYNVKRGIIEAEIRRATGHKDSKSFIRYIVYGDDDD